MASSHLMQGVRRAAVVFLFNIPRSLKPGGNPSARFFSSPEHASLSSPGKPLLPWPSLAPTPSLPDAAAPAKPPPSASEAAEPDLSVLEREAGAIARVLTAPFAEPSDLDAALDATGISPSPPLLEAVLHASELSPTSTLALFRWARARPGFRLNRFLITSLVDLLGKSRSFSAAWSVLLAGTAGAEPLPHTDAFVALIRRYARAGMPQAAIRTYEYLRDSHPLPGPPPVSTVDADATDAFDLLIDALCKEGHTRAAAEYLNRRREAEPGWSPTVRSYNILLNGWLRSRRLRNAEQLWEGMRRDGSVRPTVVTYGTMIEGLCRMRRVDRAVGLLEEMSAAGILPNEITCNPVVDALAEAGRFREALGEVERFPLYGISPNISTYNSLVKGFCKKGDLPGASKVLKTMIGRGILPTPTTYNYFFRFFVGSGRIEEGMALYNKMIEGGYAPDRLTYQLLIKLLCEGRKADLAGQVIGEMRARGLDSDLATSSMVVHLLCRARRFEEACEEFESMVKRGIVPQYLTCRMLAGALRRAGRSAAASNVEGLMAQAPHSKKLPGTYRERDGGEREDVKGSVMRKAREMADALKLAREKGKKGGRGGAGGCPAEDPAGDAERLVSDIRRRVSRADRGSGMRISSPQHSDSDLPGEEPVEKLGSSGLLVYK